MVATVRTPVTLPNAPDRYDQTNEARTRAAIAQAIAQCVRSGQNIVLPNSVSLILTAPNGSQWALSVSNTGVLTTTAV